MMIYINNLFTPVIIVNYNGIIIKHNNICLESFGWDALENKSILTLMEPKYHNIHKKLFDGNPKNKDFRINITVNVVSQELSNTLWTLNIVSYKDVGWFLTFLPFSDVVNYLQVKRKNQDKVQSFIDHEIKQKFSGVSLIIEDKIKKHKSNNTNTNTDDVVIKYNELNEIYNLCRRGIELCYNAILQRQLYNNEYTIKPTKRSITDLVNSFTVNTVLKNNIQLNDNEQLYISLDWNILNHIMDNAIINAKSYGNSISCQILISNKELRITVINDIHNEFRDIKNTGLGSDIIDKCVDILSGYKNITFIEKTAHFLLTIPLNPDNIIIIPILESPNSSPGNQNFLKEKTILVLDDELIMRKTSKRFIEDHMKAKSVILGEKSEHCSNIIEYIDKFKPDILILDENLTYFDKNFKGTQIANNLRHKNINIPIVIRSANDDIDSKENARVNGCCGFMSKSLNIEQMISELNSIYSNFIRHEGGLFPEEENK